MILTKNVEIKITNKNIRSHYSNLGYKTQYRLNVLVNHLLKNSHVKVDVKCDVCGKEKELQYYKYNRNISKHDIYACSNRCAQIKNEKTSMDKFGEIHFSKTQLFRDIICKNEYKPKSEIRENRKCLMCDDHFMIRKKYPKITCSRKCYLSMIKSVEYKNMVFEKTKDSLMKKYGVDNQFKREDIIEKIRSARILNGHEIPEADLSDWNKYKRIVTKLTRRSKKKLFEDWNGIDHYDGEYIKNNLFLSHLDASYPTIDHKFSVFFGFKNNISVEEISKIENLCITKRILNILKRTKNENEFSNL